MPIVASARGPFYGHNLFFFLLGIFPLIFRYFCFIRLHIKLRSSFTTDDGQSLFGCRLISSIVDAAILVLGFNVQNVFHIQLKRIRTPGAHHAWAFVDFEPSASWNYKHELLLPFHIFTKITLDSYVYLHIVSFTFKIVARNSIDTIDTVSIHFGIVEYRYVTYVWYLVLSLE